MNQLKIGGGKCFSDSQGRARQHRAAVSGRALGK